MILVLNLNMAVDKTVYLEEFRRGHIHRFPSALTLPGGKGVNVARVLKTLGEPCLIMGFIAGHNGSWIEENLRRSGFKAELIRHYSGESRICYSVADGKGFSTDFNEDGPAVDSASQEKFLSAFEKRLAAASFVSLSGRSVRGLKKRFYRRLAAMARKKGVPFFADLSGAPLRDILSEGAVAVKINNYEFEHTFGLNFSARALDSVFKKYEPRGLELMVVTNRHLPFYCRAHQGLFEVSPPSLKNFKTPVGAGDSFMAALLARRLKNHPLLETLSFCAGAAASDCETLGAGIISPKAVSKYQKMVRIKEMI